VFSESQLPIDDVRVPYAEAGQGAVLLHVPGDDGLRLTPAHDLLARRFRVIALDLRGSGRAPAQTVTTLRLAIERLGLDVVNLVATGNASAAALRLALETPDRVRTLVLESPTALDDGSAPPDTELERRLPEVATPTLVLFGTGDRVGTQETGRRYAEPMPNGHLVFVYDATGTIAHDRPEAFAEIVADFVERHEAFVISRTPTVIHP
jgi:pimeloyl-ACP methyl ester carboxylesterase